MTVTGQDECRACGGTNLRMFIDLGEQPPANRLVDPAQAGDPDPMWPLRAYACAGCGLVQLPNRLPPDYFAHYLYKPSISETMVSHFRALAASVVPPGPPAPLVLDIGCNDGTLLEAFRGHGARVIGVDPAKNLADELRPRGIQVRVEHFGPESAASVVSQHGPVDLITCTNTLNHIDDLRSFFSGLARCLAPQGSVVIEVPSVLAFLRETQFDTLYHEHLSVFGITALDALAARVGLAVTRVTPLDLHGGSLRIVLEREGAAIDPAVNTTRDREAREGATVSETLDSFSQRVATIREAVVRHLTEARDSGRRVAGYCAPAKATTLLNAFQIDPTLLPYVVDNSPLKQGRLIPGCRIPIVSAAVLQEQPPEELLILAWNLAREIQRKEADFARAGGRFLVPVPELRVLA